MTQPEVTESKADQAHAVKLCALGSDGVTLYALKCDETTGALMLVGMPSALGPTTPAASLSVTGSLATTQIALDDANAGNSATAFASLVAGPGGICIRNTSAAGSGLNVRIDSAPTISPMHGKQLGPQEEFVFAVTNANVLKHFAESGSPTVSASQA